MPRPTPWVSSTFAGPIMSDLPTPWVRWHYVRTGATTVAFGLLCIPATT